MTPMRRYEQTWLPEIFNDFFANDWMNRTNATAPAINVIENENDYKVEVAAPGMTKEDFKVNITDDNYLVLTVEKKNARMRTKRRSIFAGSSHTTNSNRVLLFLRM